MLTPIKLGVPGALAGGVNAGESKHGGTCDSSIRVRGIGLAEVLCGICDAIELSVMELAVEGRWIGE